MSEGLSVLLIIGGYLVLFPLLWVAIIKIVGRVGGWTTLARRFAAKTPVDGQAFTFASARIGRFANYGNVLEVRVSPKGIFLHPFILFRVGHPPLFIPWAAVAHIRRWRFLWMSSVTLTIAEVGDDWSMSLSFYGTGLGDSLVKQAPCDLRPD